jgi:hypothetical protein
VHEALDSFPSIMKQKPKTKNKLGVVVNTNNSSTPQTSRRLRLEDCKFKDSLGYTVKPCLKNQKQVINEVGSEYNAFYKILC